VTNCRPELSIVSVGRSAEDPVFLIPPRQVDAVSFVTSGKVWEAGLFGLPLRHRLAFREFGTAMGVRCHHEARSGSDWDDRAGQIVAVWEAHGLPDKPTGVPEKLCPITLVMYAAAIMPGGAKTTNLFQCIPVITLVTKRVITFRCSLQERVSRR
jgi:hypothetical protein